MSDKETDLAIITVLVLGAIFVSLVITESNLLRKCSDNKDVTTKGCLVK